MDRQELKKQIEINLSKDEITEKEILLNIMQCVDAYVDKLSLPSIESSTLIKFNEVDTDGNMYLPNSIKIRGRIKDFYIDENGVKIIKNFSINGGSV